ncbi:MAG TPA: alpha-amylase/4-alpha-glucanotransferase domain-containing protein [Nitrospirota bacterium]|nr:alpha-amylase/4-alpha-glucanotransferase domain-containing protein [Nitrospirota bacterium]
MKKVRFIFAIHNHQPVGNFGFVAEDAYQRAYLPLIEVLKEHPWFSFNLHFTGPLLEWLAAEHPEYIGMLREMAASGQVEMLGGGFYEPILALLPDEDKAGQIRKLALYIKEHFGQKPKGMWLAERVWEPHLPYAINSAGVEYVVVDDFHFKMSGLRDDELTGYFLTEERGATLKVFPGSERLRYTMPFKEPEETIAHLRGLPDAGEHTLAVMADDGEKFGVWPGTHKWVYEDGWLKRFLDAVEENRDWIIPTTFGDYIKEERARGRVYLSTCSYMEMGEWSLPARAMAEYEDFLEELKSAPGYDTKRLFVKGGFFRNFLAKYPESNAMHKRMLQVSAKVHRALPLAKDAPAKAGGMLEDLWRGQCNDAYWHGVFGGLYLPHLRDAVYRHLIRAEEAAEKALVKKDGGGPDYLLVEEGDFDGDLASEVMVSNGECALFVDPEEGGIIYELDYRPVSMNFMNTLARREEAYHRKIGEAEAQRRAGGTAKTIHEKTTAKEEGLSEFLHYDRYRKASLIDHFLGGDTDLDAFRTSRHHEIGDFVSGIYGLKKKKNKDSVRLALSRRGGVLGQPVRVEKTVTARKDLAGFDAEYAVTNEGQDELNTTFGVEFNFSLLAGGSSDRYFEAPGHVLKARNFASAGELNNVAEVGMVDEWLGYDLRLSFTEKAVLWRFPVETVSMSEAGFERVYQCSTVMPLWKVSIAPGASWGFGLRLRLAMRNQRTPQA